MFLHTQCLILADSTVKPNSVNHQIQNQAVHTIVGIYTKISIFSHGKARVAAHPPALAFIPK